MRLNYINENDVYEDPTVSPQYVDSLKEYCLKVLNFSEGLRFHYKITVMIIPFLISLIYNPIGCVKN